jgi:uncharacterized protein
MQITKNILLSGAGNRRFGLDIFYAEDSHPKPVVIYFHGFCGFKDWGNFDLIATNFAEEGFVFIKFNGSHNGTTPDLPEDFADLEAFGQNNYTKQLADLRVVTDWVCNPANPFAKAMDTSQVNLTGHSMGGGICILYAAEDDRIRRLITWASVSECKTPWGNWPAQKMQEWKEQGVQYYLNGRTKQQMPLYYQLFEDYENNRDRLDICKAISGLKIPVLICHGTKDEAVPLNKAALLKEWQPAAALFTVESDHVFGRSQPWPHAHIPPATEALVKAGIDFLKTTG